MNSPEVPLDFEEKRRILCKTYLSKSDFIRISDLPKTQALRIFNRARRNYVKERAKLNKDNTYFADPSSTFLPTIYMLKVMPALKRFVKGD